MTAAINGVTGTVQFAGLTPGSAGLYQVNVLLPQVVLTGPANVEVRIGDLRTQAKVNIPFRQLGFYLSFLGGKPVPGQTRNAAGGPNSSLAFRHSDLVAWGTEGYNAWTKNNGLNSTFSGSSGLTLTLRSGNTVVFDNNGIEDRSFNLVFATYVKLTQRTTLTEIDVYNLERRDQCPCGVPRCAGIGSSFVVYFGSAFQRQNNGTAGCNPVAPLQAFAADRGRTP